MECIMPDVEIIPEVEEIYAQIGCQLLLTQEVEHYISVLIGIVFSDQPSLNELTRLEKKTLGALKKELLKKADIDTNFLDTLEKFIDLRNLFVHNLNKQKWFDINSQSGRDAIWNYLIEYGSFFAEVHNVVLAKLSIYGEEIGLPIDDFQDGTEFTERYITMIKQYYPKSRLAFKIKK